MENGGSHIGNDFIDARRFIHTDFHRYLFWYRIFIKYASSNDMVNGDHLSDCRHSNH